MIKRLLLIAFIVLPTVVNSADVSLTGVDLHSLGRVVLGEVAQTSYELPDELAAEKTVSVYWKDLNEKDALRRYAALLVDRGYNLSKRGDVWRVVKAQNEYRVFTVHQVKMQYVLDSLSGFPGVSVSAQRGMPGMEPASGAQQSTATGSGVVPTGEGRITDTVVINGPPAQLDAWLKHATALDQAPHSLQVKAAVFEVVLTDSDASAVDLAGALLFDGSARLSLGSDSKKGAVSVGFGTLALTVAKLRQDSRFKLLSEPYVAVQSGDSARLAVGTKLPVQSQISTSDSGRQTQSVQYVDSGVVLQVQPIKRGPDWEVSVTQELSSVQDAQGVAGNPIFNNRSISTKLRAQEGETKLLAGLDSTQNTVSKATGLFNWLNTTGTAKTRSQILILMQLGEVAPGSIPAQDASL